MRTFSRVLRILSAVTLFFFCWTFLPLWEAVAFAATKQEKGAGGKGQVNQGPGAGSRGPGNAGERFEKALESIRENINKADEKLALSKVEGAEDITTAIAEVKKQRTEIEKIDVELRKEFAATEKKLKDANLPKEILARHYKFVKHYNDNLKQLKAEITGIEKAKTKSARKLKIEQAKAHLEEVKPPKKHVPLDPNNLPFRTVKGKERAPRLKKEEFERYFPPRRHPRLNLSRTGSGTKTASNPPASPFAKGGQEGDFSKWDDGVRSTLTRKPVLLALNNIASDVPFSLGLPLPTAGEGWGLPSNATIGGEGAVPQFALNDPLPLLFAQAMEGLPTAADLSLGPEVQPDSPIVRAKAAELGCNVVKLYEWTRNSVEFTPGYGSGMSTEQCLETKKCDAFAISATLLSLYRSCNVPARFVHGTVTLPADRFMNWMGGFSDIQAAISFAAEAGIPIKPIMSGGIIGKVQLEHPVIQAWIDYNPSRGERHKEGDTWIYLDAAYKLTKDVPGVEFSTSVPLDAQAFAQSLQAGITVDELSGSAVGGTCASSGQLMENYRILAGNYFTQERPGATVAGVLGKREIIKHEFPYLLGTLPYREYTVGVKTSDIPDTLRHKATFKLTNDAGTSIEITKSLPELSGKKITLSYVPATQADRDVIANYLPQTTGAFDLSSLPASLPAYLITVKAELRIEGTLIATGPATGLGKADTLTINLTSPDQNIDSVSRNVTAGEFVLISLNAGDVSLARLQALEAKLADTRAKLQSGASGLTREEVLGDLLQAAALTFKAERDLKDRILGKAFGVTASRGASNVLVSSWLDTTYSFGLPIKVKAGGLSLDLVKDGAAVASLSGDHEKEKQYRLVSGLDGASRAAGIFDELFGAGPSAGAVRALQAAKGAAIPIHTINQANISTILPLLQLDADTLSDIQNAVNANLVVVTSRSPVTLNGKTATPLVLIDPVTGASAYIIHGDINGSLTYPSWSTLTPVLNLAWDSLVTSLSNLSQSSLSDSFMTAFQAVQNGVAGFSSGVPAHYAGLLTEGLFYAAAANELGCYLTSTPSSLTGPCMAAYLGSLCIADAASAIGSGNAKPQANAGSDRNVMVGNPIMLDGSASNDPNNDPLTYAWTMTSKPGTSTAVLSDPGAASPSLTPDVPGVYKFQLIVSDGKSFSDPATVAITANYETVAVPGLSGKTQTEAEAAIIASHLSVGTITQLSSDTVQQGKVLSQDPAPNAQAVKGSPVKFILSAGPATDTEKPVLTAVLDRTPSAYSAGEIATLYIEATDNSRTVNVTVSIDGASRVVTTPSTTIDTTGMAPGSVHAIEVQAADPSNNTATASLNLGILDPANTEGPVAEIITPALDAEVSAPTAIIGTVTSTRLLEYTLSYAAKGTTTFTPFAKGTTAITNGTLGTLDPTLLKNSIYDVRLYAVDTNGRSFWTDVTYRVTGDMKVGNFTVTFTDLNIPVAGLPITVNRTYDSRDKQSRDFGIGWTVDIQNTKLDENRTPGDGWPQTKTGGVFGTYCINGDTEHYVSVALPDGRTEEFDMTLTPNCQQFAPIQETTPGFAARPGTTSTLAIKNAFPLLVVNGQLIDPDTVEPYDPAGYVLTDKDGMVYDLDQKFGVKSVTDPNGNRLTYGSDGVTHSAGTGVRFVRDAKGRIVQIIAPDGNKIGYAYNSKGDLITVTDQAGNVTTYTYNRNHDLTGIKDPRGITPVKNEYDDSGRLVAHTDSYGKRIEYTHDIAGRQEVVKDRNGNLTVYIYDDKGRVLQKTDPMGNTTSFTYDGVGNKLSEIDALGNTTRWTYDIKKNVLTEAKIISNQTVTTSHTYNNLGKVLTTTDPLGHVTSNTYDSKGNLLTTTDALGNTTTNTYDAKGNLLSTKDALGNETTYAYDSYGRRISETNTSGTSYYTYDASGNRLSDTDKKSNTTLFTYDKNGKLLTTENAAGAITRTEYDKAGNKVADINPLGNITWFYYDSANRLVTTEYPDGTFTKTIYDNEGNRIASIDQEGRTTSYQYNGSKQLVKTTYPDQTTRQFGYDAAGRQTTTTDALGNVATKEYDALGRVRRSIDPEGNTTTFEYDLAGNQIKQTDPNNHSTIFAYDAANRLITTTLPGGQATTVAYDALGRKASETDAAGSKTQFDYDTQGNLVKVIDAEGGITRYEYDANNNRTAIIDARGNRTGFAFDNVNLPISKTMPNNGVETYAYDKAGRQIAKTDAKGQAVQYAYDTAGRLQARQYPDGSSVQFAYSPTGKRASARDQRGTTNYDYDLRGRLSKLTYPDNKAINYAYDLNGRISILSSFASTVTYTYSANGRLKEVRDPQGNVTTYTYDNAGNRTGLAYPNGTAVTYSYDNNNRLTNLTHRNGLSEIMASYAYTLGAIGNRTRIDEANGIGRQYTYDRLYRLTKEQVVDPANAQTYQNDFSYDAVGNRLNKTYAAYNQSAVSNDYTYNNADQLLTESGVTYTYDLNGNLASKTDATGTTIYSYDYENRLAGVTSPSGTVAYQYDVDGNRVAASNASGTTKYLVDTNRSLSQILVEYTINGTPLASYVYADDLVSMNRGGVVSYYHFDGLGSTRMLTDASGAVTDSYEYDAFGNQIAHTGATVNDFLFTGQQHDANIGFYYLRARYYQPDTGRFTALDPFAGDPYTPASLHKYSYANNNPTVAIDPNGMFTITSTLAAVAIGSIITVIAVNLYSYFKSSSLKLAVGEAAKMVYSAILQLQSWGANDKLRYKTWFGKYSSIRKKYVEDVYLKIAMAVNQNIVFHETSGNYYAYTYSGGPLEIWLGKHYYSAPLTGANSKAGTIIHELSHEVSNTSDIVYGAAGAKSLAVTSPNNAINNADNYEYFAEGL